MPDRGILRVRLLAAALLFVAFSAVAQAQLRHVTILHTNDLHARLLPDSKDRGGFAYLAAAIKHERSGCPECLLLDAGDLVQGTPVSTIYHGTPVYELASLLHIDASILGNHEFDYGWRQIRDFVRAARFPVLSANVVDSQRRLLAPRAYLIKDVNGVRVAIIGALTATLPHLTTSDRYESWRVLPVAETVRSYAQKLRPQSDLIVVLAHITTGEGDQLLSQVPEVSVIVSGHDHRGLEEPQRIGNRMLVRVNAYGLQLGRLDLTVNVAKKKVTQSSWKRIEIDAKTISPEPEMARAVNAWEDKVSKVVDVPIGEARREISADALKPLIETAMAEELHTDFAFMQRGGIRDYLPKGTLLARHVWNVMPFDDLVLVARVKGSELPSSVSEGRPIDPNKEYTLATNDFVAVNQRSELGTTALRFSKDGPLLRDLLIGWIKKKRVLE